MFNKNKRSGGGGGGSSSGTAHHHRDGSNSSYGSGTGTSTSQMVTNNNNSSSSINVSGSGGGSSSHKKRGSSNKNNNNNETIVYDTPLDELISCMDRMELLVEKTKNDFWSKQQQPRRSYSNENIGGSDEQQQQQYNNIDDDIGGTNSDSSSSLLLSTPPPPRNSSSSSSNRDRPWRRSSSKDVDASSSTGKDNSSHSNSKPPKAPTQPQQTITTPPPNNNKYNNKNKNNKVDAAKFIPINNNDQEELIEVIRRIAELVVHGERGAAREQKLRDELYAKPINLDNEYDTNELKRLRQEADYKVDEHISIFEHFFERNILALIVNIVTGVAFIQEGQGQQGGGVDDSIHSRGSSHSGTNNGLYGSSSSINNSNNNNVPTTTTMLPPLPIATQGVQSVSILIQNVSRATSLYFLLSNNFINELINLPLELYGLAELNKRGDYSSTNMLQGFSPRKYTSPEIAELSTHFVSFLKSLALRMNKETLQFYLTYPNESSNLMDGSSSAYFSMSSSDTNKDKNHGIKIITRDDSNRRIVVNDDGEEERPLDEIASNNNNNNKDDDLHQQQRRNQQAYTRTNPTNNNNNNNYDSSSRSTSSSRLHSSASATTTRTKRPVAVDKIEVEFPLYARALEFCAPHHDSFVRVTAMNVCLNTLRLSVLGESDDGGNQDNDNGDDDDDELMRNSSLAPSKSPSADLQNADPLPLRERLAIAQHVCAPTRVEGLVSPIFTKLAQLWGTIEELIREIDTIGHNRSVAQQQQQQQQQPGSRSESPTIGEPTPSSRRFGGSGGFRGGGGRNGGITGTSNMKWKAERAKDEVKLKKLSDSFKDASADLQDELELLEDVFKVGLTSLNEQIIEMMLATFVYPLLLQPLLLYAQRFPSSRQQQQHHQDNDMNAMSSSFANLGGDDDERYAGNGSNSSIDVERHDTAPAKTAFFSLGAVFHLVTNRPLLRLLLTALFHPLAPEASGESMIRAKPDVACVSNDGKVCVRVDPTTVEADSSCIPNERTSYLFGKLTGQRRLASESTAGGWQQQQKEESCVFVMSPALADVLESDKGESATSLLSRTRPNPYRKAILSCLADTFGMSELRSLAVYTFDAAVSKFDGKFVSDILFGIGLKTFGNEIPVDERRSDTRRVRATYDRGMGGPAQTDSYSRHTLNTTSRFQTGGDSDYMVEVVASLCVSVMNAYNSSTNNSSRYGSSLRALKFDKTAAHALLCIIRQNPKSIQTAAKLIERRRSQTASYVAKLPSKIDQASYEADQHRGMPEDDEQRLGILMDRIFYQSSPGSKSKSVVETLFRFADPPPQGVLLNQPDNDFLIPITMESSYVDLSNRICSIDEIYNDVHSTNNDNWLPIAAECASAHLQLDVFSNLMHELAATNGNAIKQSKNKKLAGFAISQSGMIVDTTVHWEQICQKSIFSPLSRNLTSVLFEEQTEDDTSARSHRHHHRTSSDHSRGPPKAGSVVGLVGRTAFPCVCEVPADNASLFTDDGACVVAEGVKWQSLYLVFLGRYMILAEPERGGSGGNGRIVTACNLVKLKVEKDDILPEGQGGSPARRLLLTHDSFIERSPPSLFVLEEQPTYKQCGNLFRGVTNTKTCLDLWFEDENAADRAFKVIDVKIAKSKSKHGNKIRETLSPTDN